MPSAVPMNWLGPRSMKSMNTSPAISSEVLVHRVHEMHRSRSSSTSVEMATGLAKVRLSSVNRVSPWPVGHGLVLQRALAALVAHRAVERVVDEQELHHAPLRLLRDRRGELGVHHHALGARGDAGGQRLVLALDLDQALAAGADRIEQRVIAEPRDRDAEHSAARMISMPFGTTISNPSMVTVTVSCAVCTVMLCSRQLTPPGRRGSRPPCGAA